MRTLPAVLTLALALVAPAAARAQETHWLIVSGLGGEPEYRDLFRDWGTRLATVARSQGSWVRYLGERPDEDARIDAAPRKEGLEAVFDSLGTATEAGDEVVVVLIGHGSADDGGARINLPGPDLSDGDFSELLSRLEGRRIVFVNTASASGEYVRTLSGPGRVVLTATRSSGERNQTRFGGFFVEALEGGTADADKDGRVSVLEAFLYARRETLRTYETDNKLATEHALLDDNADGRGSEEPSPTAEDGGMAATFYLARTGTAAVVTDPAVAPLVAERERLERRIAELRPLKDSMEPAEYERQLEELLLELALVNRRLQGGGA